METPRNEELHAKPERKPNTPPQVMEYGIVADLVRGFKRPYVEIEGHRDTIRV